MQMKGEKMYSKTRSPTEAELRDLLKLQLTSRSECNPTTVLLHETTTNNREVRQSMQISKFKISPNIIDFKYLDASDDASLLNSIEPLL